MYNALTNQIYMYLCNNAQMFCLFFQGYNHPNAYIAAQGPMPNTISDFWRMVWEYKLVTVVMLTKCTEAGKVSVITNVRYHAKNFRLHI